MSKKSNATNYQVDVGPTSAGVIPPIMQERLLQMGEWLGNNGEAVRQDPSPIDISTDIHIFRYTEAHPGGSSETVATTTSTTPRPRTRR